MEKFIMAKIMRNDPIPVSKDTTLLKLSENYSKLFKYPIIIAKVNNELQELHKTLTDDSDVEFLDATDVNGYRAYQTSAAFMMICAAKEVLGKKVRIVIEHSINKNYYCEIIDDNIVITNEILKKIENKMHRLVKENLPFEKFSLSLEKCLALSEEFGLEDKIKILKFRRTANVNFYKLDGFYDYFHGQLAPSTGYIKLFKISKQATGFILQFPKSTNLNEIEPLRSFEKISKVFVESSQWARILNIDTVGSLNEKICDGKIGEIIRITEALHEKKIASIADQILQNNRRIILIAGPSSSGKTTFSYRLAVQLKVNGLNPHIISLDDYFNDQINTPHEDNNDFDYESINAIDIKQINEDLENLLKGNTVNIPSFNFATGRRENRGRYLKLNEKDVMIIEGIHGLNDKTGIGIKHDLKFKIFISALTQLNVDDHNRIPTTDTRMLRRIVRDNRFRKLDAATTIKMWPSVMRGESENIFPFQEVADAVFNSALVYELSVLKQFVEPILFKIDKSQPQYTEARRLIKFLDSFLGVSSEEVPKNSIIREFIAGSCFS